MGRDDAELLRVKSVESLDKRVIFKEIPIIYLKRGEYQPRYDFPEEGIISLAETIKRDGILA